MESPPEDGEQIQSKSARKREMHALVDLAESMSGLSPTQLGLLPLADNTRDALLAARRMQRGAFRRQLRLIARYLDERENVSAVRAAYEGMTAPGRLETARLHRIERWRDRLIEHGDAAVELFMTEHPGADRQYLRNLVRAARRPPVGAAAPRTLRTLFRYLREFADPA